MTTLILKNDKLYKIGFLGWLSFVNYKYNMYLYNDYDIITEGEYKHEAST